MALKIKIVAVILLTASLTGFYYAHEFFPKPLRAATSLLATPTAVASGISHYLKLGISVYESPLAVIIANIIASIIIVLVIDKFLQWRKRKGQAN